MCLFYVSKIIERIPCIMETQLIKNKYQWFYLIIKYLIWRISCFFNLSLNGKSLTLIKLYGSTIPFLYNNKSNYCAQCNYNTSRKSLMIMMKNEKLLWCFRYYHIIYSHMLWRNNSSSSGLLLCTLLTDCIIWLR